MHSGKKYSRINCVDVKVGIRGISLFEKLLNLQFQRIKHVSPFQRMYECFTFSMTILNVINNRLMFKDNYKRNNQSIVSELKK